MYLQRWACSAVEHYQFDNRGFANIEGYEVLRRAANINKARHGPATASSPTSRWGQPAQVADKLLGLRRAHRRRRPRRAALCFGGMDADEVAVGLRDLRRGRAPRAQRHDAGGDVGVTYVFCGDPPRRGPGRADAEPPPRLRASSDAAPSTVRAGAPPPFWDHAGVTRDTTVVPRNEGAA